LLGVHALGDNATPRAIAENNAGDQAYQKLHFL
jgi:hypothetical protein